MKGKWLFLIYCSLFLFGCGAHGVKSFSAEKDREGLQSKLKPGYIITIYNEISTHNFVLVEATDKGLKGKDFYVGRDVMFPYENIKNISWETKYDSGAGNSNTKLGDGEAAYFLESVIIWLPVLL